jgi:hypothetical protein
MHFTYLPLTVVDLWQHFVGEKLENSFQSNEQNRLEIENNYKTDGSFSWIKKLQDMLIMLKILRDEYTNTTTMTRFDPVKDLIQWLNNLHKLENSN